MTTDQLRILDDGRAANGVCDKPPSPAARPVVPIGFKRCPACGETKPLSGFNRNRSRKDGHESHCRPCSNAGTQRWRAAGCPPRNPDYDYPLRGRTEKRCPVCGLTKPIAAYRANASRYDGVDGLCTPCMRDAQRRSRRANSPSAERLAEHHAYLREWRSSHPEYAEQVKESRRERYNSDPTYREKLLADTRARSRKARVKIDKLKSEMGCLFCPEAMPCALDFHHVEEKEFSISQATTKGFAALMQEATKCVILCANCHRKVHAGALVVPPDARRAVVV